MGSYVVTSSNLTVAAEGSTVTADQLAGCDIPALVAGGHLAPVETADPDAVQTSPVPTQPPAATAATPKEQ